MGMMKRFYEAEKVSVLYYSSGHIRKVTFTNNHDGLYLTEIETRDGHGNVLERYADDVQTIQGVERCCNAICENQEVISITIE